MTVMMMMMMMMIIINNIFNQGKPVSRSCYKYRTIPENKPLQI